MFVALEDPFPGLTRTTARSCRDPETAVKKSLLVARWRLPQAAAAASTAAIAPAAAAAAAATV